MKSKIIYLAALLAFSFGCDDDLINKQDPGSGSVEAFFNNEAELIMGINGIYNALQGDFWGGSFIHIQPEFDGASDNAQTCCPWGWGFWQIADGTLAPTTGGMASFKWDFGYQGVSKVNQMLEIIPTIEDLTAEAATKWEAELKFLRGYFYFEMQFYYGDIPLITKVITTEEASALTRDPRASVVTQAIEDLTFAGANLEMTPNNGQLGRPTKQAALALLGKVYLYEERWAEAQTTLEQVVAMEGATLGLEPSATYGSIFDGTNEASKEILWSLQSLDNADEGTYVMTQYGIPGTASFNGWNGMIYSQELVDDFHMTDGLSISTSPLYDAADPYANRDLRLAGSFYVPGDTWNGTVLTPELNFLYNGDRITAVAAAAEVLVRKWIQTYDLVGGNSNASGVDYVVMRYADVLLHHAEAANEAGNTAAALASLNKIRNRAGLPDTPGGTSQADLRDIIRHERRVEFVMEGTRYQDLLRWRTAETVIPSNTLGPKTFDASKNYLWPIPQTAMDANSGLVQNPGY